MRQLKEKVWQKAATCRGNPYCNKGRQAGIKPQLFFSHSLLKGNGCLLLWAPKRNPHLTKPGVQPWKRVTHPLQSTLLLVEKHQQALLPTGACLGNTQVFIWELPVLSWRTNYISAPGFVFFHCSASKNHRQNLTQKKTFSLGGQTKTIRGSSWTYGLGYLSVKIRHLLLKQTWRASLHRWQSEAVHPTSSSCQHVKQLTWLML